MVLAQVMSAPLPTILLLWVANITAPFEPLSLGLSPHSGEVIVGGRDCPENTNSTLFTYDLHKGSLKRELTGLSQASVARGGDGIFAGVGWNKEQHYTNLRGPGGYALRYDGEPSEMLPTAISHDGTLAAYLLEPNPDMAHINNRSGTLALIDGDTGKLSFEYNVTGQGSFDPQSVAMSPSPSKVRGWPCLC